MLALQWKKEKVTSRCRRTPRLNDFRIFSRTPKDAKHILVLLLRPLTRFKHKLKNLSLSEWFPELYHFSVWIEFPPQFECLRATLLLAYEGDDIMQTGWGEFEPVSGSSNHGGNQQTTLWTKMSSGRQGRWQIFLNLINFIRIKYKHLNNTGKMLWSPPIQA